MVCLLAVLSGPGESDLAELVVSGIDLLAYHPGIPLNAHRLPYCGRLEMVHHPVVSSVQVAGVHPAKAASGTDQVALGPDMRLGKALPLEVDWLPCFGHWMHSRLVILALSTVYLEDADLLSAG